MGGVGGPAGATLAAFPCLNCNLGKKATSQVAVRLKYTKYCIYNI